jgi:hypothetical protein
MSARPDHRTATLVGYNDGKPLDQPVEGRPDVSWTRSINFSNIKEYDRRDGVTLLWHVQFLGNLGRNVAFIVHRQRLIIEPLEADDPLVVASLEEPL